MKPYLIFLSSWFFPGSGHFIQKKYKRALLYFGGVVTLLILGIIMKGRFYTHESLHPLLILGFLGDLGNGLFYFLIKALNLSSGDITAETFHYGTTYLACAGLLNYLIALNAFDIARGKRK